MKIGELAKTVLGVRPGAALAALPIESLVLRQSFLSHSANVSVEPLVRVAIRGFTNTSE